MADELVLTVPAELMEWLAVTAERDFRAPAGQALWLLSQAMKREPSRITATAAHAELISELRSAHLAAGAPSTRMISRRIAQRGGRVSHTSVHDAINGNRLVSWPMTEAIVKALGADVSLFRRLWAAARTSA